MRKYLTESNALFLAGMGVLFFHHGEYWNAHWLSKWAFLVALFGVVCAFWAAKRTHWAFFPLMAYVTLNSASVGVWADNIYFGKANPISLLSLERNALYAYTVLIMCILFMGSFTKTWRLGALRVLAFVGYASVVRTIFMDHPTWDGGFSGNPSMSGCLIAAMLPFMWTVLLERKWKPHYVYPLVWFPAAYAIYLTQTSVPIGVLGVVTAAYAFAHYRARIEAWMIAGILLVVLPAWGWFGMRMEFVNNSGRLSVWKLVWNWWKDNAPHAFGARFGSALVLTPILQVIHDTSEHNYWIWLHNDWLQILIESGYVGAGLFLATWAFVLKWSWKRRDLFASFAAFSVMGLMNYPLRLPIHAFCLMLVVCLIKEVIAEEAESRRSSEIRALGKLVQGLSSSLKNRLPTGKSRLPALVERILGYWGLAFLAETQESQSSRRDP